jgi:hypothetical protein
MVASHSVSSLSFRLLWTIAAVGLAGSVTASCAETAADADRPGSSDDAVRQSDDDLQTAISAQQVSNAGWIAGGAGGQVSLVSADGQPDTIVGRVANDGAGVESAAVGNRGWLTAGANGQTQLIDDQGKPLSEPRVAIRGNQISCVASRGENWLVGGGGGRIQRVNVDGQPTSDEKRLFSGNSAATAAASNRSSSWLVGSADGDLVRMNHTTLTVSTTGVTLENNAEAVEIRWQANVNNWLVLTPNGFATFTSGGGVSTTTDFGVSATMTTAVTSQSKVAVGRSDGRIAIADQGALASASWVNVLDGNAVRDIAYNGTNWLVVGDNGKAVRVDDSGSVVGSMKTLAGGRGLSAARPLDSGWMVSVAGISAVQSVSPDLTGMNGGANQLNGTEILTVVSGKDATLIAGENGAYRLLNPDGSAEGSVKSVDGLDGDITAGAWNGRNFFVGASTGEIIRIKPNGEVRDSLSVLGDKSIIGMAYTGSFWLVAAADGTIRRLRPSGTPYQEITTIPLETVNAVGFNGDYWLLVGTHQGSAGYMGYNTEGDVEIEPVSIPESAELHSVEWGGREWLVGGTDGIAYRIDQVGSVIRQGQASGPRDVFYEATIRGINFDGENYLLTGDFGLVRRLQFSTLPYAPGKVVNTFNTLRGIDWTVPRGFPGGRCVSQDSCLQGSCVGTISDGVCCNEPCEGPCVSCFSSVTGEPSGTCAPVPNNEEPPSRKQTQGIDCAEEAEETCGQTGTCDGQGSCQLYSSDVQCRSASCEATDNGAEIVEAAFCDGDGNCPSGSTTSCDPYMSCQEQAAACSNTCSTDQDCITGYVCESSSGGGSSQCVEGGSSDDGNGGGSGDSGGCTTAGQPLSAGTLLLSLLLGVGVVRLAGRRRRGR